MHHEGETATRSDLAFEVRKLAEAWWKLAEAIELGNPRAGAQLLALVAITEQAGEALRRALPR